MNKELELEADLWSVNTDNVHPADSYVAKQGFIAGATSKYVEKQKLEFAIEQLNNALLKADSKDAIRVCILQIEELEQQLKKLENEK